MLDCERWTFWKQRTLPGWLYVLQSVIRLVGQGYVLPSRVGILEIVPRFGFSKQCFLICLLSCYGLFLCRTQYKHALRYKLGVEVNSVPGPGSFGDAGRELAHTWQTFTDNVPSV